MIQRLKNILVNLREKIYESVLQKRAKEQVKAILKAEDKAILTVKQSHKEQEDLLQEG